VTGAQPGSISISKRTKGFPSQLFSGSGQLYLSKPGTDHVLFPRAFTFTINGPEIPINNKPTPVTITLGCALKAHSDPVALTLKVTGTPVAAPGSGGHGSTAVNGAVPAGAPNTGGGSRPGSDLPMAAGGVALLLTGAGFVIVARRRRQGQPTS
jgi:hypothetical protein